MKLLTSGDIELNPGPLQDVNTQITSYMVIHITTCKSDKLVLFISGQTQNISLKAIPTVHGMTIWPTCHSKVHDDAIIVLAVAESQDQKIYAVESCGDPQHSLVVT
ncbi:hypothetical protein pdam_00007925 [Pocillopora damicornis]|uniref:Uncharacterized protein n=1 Tax=Pocillopora damicornis TaxID=46731 RepID=A0A3M6UEY2_POCDA|nr:hypothetical protein pdam_00007925 [Pocillopora damicornis]